MIDFEPINEQKMLVNSISRFAEGPMRRVFRESEEDGKVPAEIVRSGWDFGLLPSGIPEDLGGFGEYCCVTGALALESFSYGDLGITLNITTPNLMAIPIFLAGTEEQKRKHLPGFCGSAPPRVSAAMMEPSIHVDLRNLSTSARRENGSYIINGTKMCVAHADNVDLILVYADEDGRTQAFLVPGDTEGLITGSREKLMGIRAFPTHRVQFQNCRVPLASKLGGNEGIDFGIILNHCRLAMSAAAVGVARAAYDYAREYAKNRVQFEEPIAHRQSIAFMLAEMAIDVDAAHLLILETAWHLDRGDDATKETTIMKQFVDKMVLRVADRAVQVLGGYGYVREYPVELWLRNARGFSSLEGLSIL